MPKRIYLAGGLFNAAQRLFNILLAEELRKRGFEVIVPQERALDFFHEGKFDIGGVVEDCFAQSGDRGNVVVANLDGPSADDGTSMEYGVGLRATGTAIGVRTDFRTALDSEVGVNAMFRRKGTALIYRPAFFTTAQEFNDFLLALADEIAAAVRALGD